MTTAIVIPRKKHAAPTSTAANASLLLRPVIAELIIASTTAGAINRSGCQASPMRLAKIDSAAR